MYNSNIDVPYIDSETIHTSEKINMVPPHDHQHVLGQYSMATAEHVNMAIDAALKAEKNGRCLHQRVAIF